MKKIIFLFLIISTALLGKSFIIEGEIKYNKSDLIFINYDNIDLKLRSILKNEINICNKVTISSTTKNVFWILSFDKKMNKFYLEDKVNGNIKSYSFNNYSNKADKIHAISNKVNEVFKCDNNWISKKIVKIVKIKNKITELYVSDISGENQKMIYRNNSLLLFPFHFENRVYFTSIVDNTAYLLELNEKTGKVKKILKEENGYLIVSDVKRINNSIKIVYTSITNNGQIQINIKSEKKYRKEVLTRIYKQLTFSKMILNPKLAPDGKTLFFIAQTSNGTYDLFRFDFKKRTIIKMLDGKKIVSYDINKNKDIIYKDIHNGVFNYYFYDNRTHKRYRLNTLKGKISKPLFVKDTGFIFSKSYKNSNKKNIFYYDLKNQRTIKMNRMYQGFQNFDI